MTLKATPKSCVGLSLKSSRRRPWRLRSLTSSFINLCKKWSLIWSRRRWNVLIFKGTCSAPIRYSLKALSAFRAIFGGPKMNGCGVYYRASQTFRLIVSTLASGDGLFRLSMTKVFWRYFTNYRLYGCILFCDFYTIFKILTSTELWYWFKILSACAKMDKNKLFLIKI